MDLLVDLGNTRLKWEVRRDDAVIAQGAAIHAGHDMFHLLDAQWANLQKPTSIWIGSVAGPQQTAQIASWARAYWNLTAKFAQSTSTAAGVRNGYTEPAKLGVDRWLALIAAWHLDHSAACIVDCGTAVTIDAIDEQGQHLGGCILPGIMLMQQVVPTRTPQVKPDQPGALVTFPQTTADALCSGATLAVVGAIDSFTDRVRARFSQSRLLISGGDALTLQALLKEPYQYVANLVLDGLGIIAATSK